MFKKHLLAAAVLSLSAGIAFADNEAVIDQSDTAATGSIATIEQVISDVTVPGTSFGQIIQNATDTTTASVYQGPADAGSAIDPTAPASTNTAATAIDLTLDAYKDTVNVYTPVLTAAGNYALIKQDTTGAATTASIIQTTGDDLANLSDTTVTLGANTAGLSGGQLTIDGTNLYDAGLSLGDTTLSHGNIGAISQNAAVVDRAGAALGGTTQAGNTSPIEAALLIQLGTNNIAQILQAGDGDNAAVVQDGDLNDAFVAQYGVNGTVGVLQLASTSTATVYQGGDTNAASITQRQVTGDNATIYQDGTSNTATINQHLQ